MTHKFKVGDRVISNDEGYSEEANWPRGVVTAIPGDADSWYRVRFDRVPLIHYEDELGFDPGPYEKPSCEPAGQGATARPRTLPEDSAARKQYPLFTGPVLYFPAALAAVAKLCKDGNDKHNPGEPMHHARGKSTDHEDTILRHMLDAREGDGCDADGTPHLVNVAWRALALLQEYLERHGAPLAPGAREDKR